MKTAVVPREAGPGAGAAARDAEAAPTARTGSVDVQDPRPGRPWKHWWRSDGLPRSAAWRQVVLDRERQLEALRKRLLDGARAGGVAAPAELCGCGSVRERLEQAKQAAGARQGPLRWWHGTLVERAWLSLHQAEYLLVRHMTPSEAAGWWQTATGNRPQPLPWKAAPKRVTDSDVPTIALSVRAHYERQDRKYGQVRALRNRMVVCAGLGLALVLVLFLAATRWSWDIPGPVGDAVVTGRNQFLLVALFGVVGAFVVGLPSVLTAKLPRSPYHLSGYQLALKVTVGPLFALLGILLVQAGVVTQMEAFTSFGPAVLVWAAIFGGGQQLVTGIFDRQAKEVLGEGSTTEKAEPGEPVE